MAELDRKFARLNKDDINKLQDLEKETGKVIIAYEPDSTYAKLSEDQLKKIQQMEKELGVILIAYKP